MPRWSITCCLALALIALQASAVHGEGSVTATPAPGTLGTGLGAWASVLAHVLVNREGGADGARAALASFEAVTRSQLKALADGMALPGAKFPDLPIIRDAAAFSALNPFGPKQDSGSRKEGASFAGKAFTPKQITGASLSSVFFNYAPCLISQDAVGAAATAVGINIVPQIVNVAVKGASVLPIGVNINPAVILVNPQGVAVWPRGVNVQPTLIAIAPTGTAVVPHGVSVDPYGIAVTGK